MSTSRDQPFFFSLVHISFIFVTRLLNKLFDYFRILSLDVAFGGVVLSASLAQAFGMSLPFTIVLGLFLAIWLIYSFDHLLDAQKLRESASMRRHKFHFENRKTILIVMMIMMLVGLGNMIFMPVITLIMGLIVTFFVAFYFFLSWKFKLFLIKEVFIASIYATGVVLGPVSLGGIDQASLFFIIFQFFGLALLNLLIISNY